MMINKFSWSWNSPGAKRSSNSPVRGHRSLDNVRVLEYPSSTVHDVSKRWEETGKTTRFDKARTFPGSGPSGFGSKVTLE